MGLLIRGLPLPGTTAEADPLEGAVDSSRQRNMFSTGQDKNLHLILISSWIMPYIPETVLSHLFDPFVKNYYSFSLQSFLSKSNKIINIVTVDSIDFHTTIGMQEQWSGCEVWNAYCNITEPEKIKHKTYTHTNTHTPYIFSKYIPFSIPFCVKVSIFQTGACHTW